MKFLPLTLENLKATFPNHTGLCYIGDPCYVIGDDLWDLVCDSFYAIPPEREKVEANVAQRILQYEDKRANGFIAPHISKEEWIATQREWAQEDAFNGTRRYPYILFLADDLPIIIANTNYGDGAYPVYHTREGVATEHTFGVDAGMMSIIPLPTLQKLCPTGVQDGYDWRVPRYSEKLIPLGLLLHLSLGEAVAIETPKQGDLTIVSPRDSLIIKTSSPDEDTEEA